MAWETHNQSTSSGIVDGNYCLDLGVYDLGLYHFQCDSGRIRLTNYLKPQNQYIEFIVSISSSNIIIGEVFKIFFLTVNIEGSLNCHYFVIVTKTKTVTKEK